MNSIETTDIDIIRKILGYFLDNCFISNFSYYMDAHIDFGRPYNSEISELVPRVFRLILPSFWWVGDRREWDKCLHNNFKTFFGSDNEGPIRAYALACLFSTRLNGFSLNDIGDLTLNTIHGESLHLKGKDEEEDETWALIIPNDVPNYGSWYVSCDPSGVVHCKYPAEAVV